MPRNPQDQTSTSNKSADARVRAYSPGAAASTGAAAGAAPAPAHVPGGQSQLQARRYATVDRPVRSQGSPGLFPLENPGVLVGGAILTLVGLKNWRSFLGLGLAGVGVGLIYSGLQKNRAFDPDLPTRLLNTMATEGSDVSASITIARPVADVWAAWRNLSNLAHCMSYIEAVQPIDQTRWHFIARAPKGDFTVQWDAEIIEEVENELLVWRSIEGSELNNEGMVEFIALPDGQRTEIRARIVYFPPAGKVGHALAELLKGLSTKFVEEDLRNFKQFVETDQLQSDIGQTRKMFPGQLGGSTTTGPSSELR